MYCVGLDVHQNSSSLEVLDANGKLFKRLEVKGPWPQVMEALAQLPQPMALCYEASCGYGHLYEKFSTLCQKVRVAHPGKLRLIYASKRKNNRLDASKLAKLLYLDVVPTVHVPQRQIRQWRQTIEFRQALLAGRVKIKNRLRAFLREGGVLLPREASGQKLWTKKGQQVLAQLQLSEVEAMRRDMLLEQLSEADVKLKRVEKYLDKLADASAAVTLLRTIPGVGRRTAEALAAYIDDVRRFRRNKCLGAYFGLVPCQDASGDKNRLGHITRDGPSTVRKLLCEAAWVAIRRSATVKRFFERVMHQDTDRKKIAIVATAHYLLRVAGAILKSGECWQEGHRPVQAKAMTVLEGGGETPSGPKGSPLPLSRPLAHESQYPPPPHSASPFSPDDGQGAVDSEAGPTKRRVHVKATN